MPSHPADDDSFAHSGVPAEVSADVAFTSKYKVERTLGIGGAGIVVCARHLELDERVAIKFLLSGPENQDAIARFRREARAANRVKDEHVVRIIDIASTTSGVPYVVMEYLDGVDLERMLQQSPDRQLPVRDAIEFVLQACEALAECHAIGIVHRDLKPSNLFCTHGADGLPIIKVLDFGISKLGPTTVEPAVTGAHAIIGSPRYMSPEQFSAPSEVDNRTDIWALGIILYELVTGVAPFLGDTLIAIWERVKATTPKPIADLRRDAPLALGPVILRCLEKEPAKRFQNVAELAKALLPLAPERSRGSVARIVRIVEAPGVNTASLSLPPSGRIPAETATSVSIRSEPEVQQRPRRVGLVVLAVAATVIVALIARRELGRPSATSDAKATPTVTKVAAEPAAPVTVAEPALQPLAPSVAPTADEPKLIEAVSAPIAPTSTAPSGASKRTQRQTAVAATATPSAVATAIPPKPATTPSVESTRTSPSASPWIVDIVEKRKTQPGDAP